MTISELSESATNLLPFSLTDSQAQLLTALSAFVLHHGPRDVFVLNGYAGTGKTSVVGALIRAMNENKIKTVNLAPTGRAAKVASKFSGISSQTIHKRIFRGNSLDPLETHFFLAENTDRDTIFFIDEASLIVDNENFNSSLLQQLIRHIYSAPGCAMILLGDIAQLPPIGMSKSPAMNQERLVEMGLSPILFTLNQPLRQSAKSGILYNATAIRYALEKNLPFEKYMIFKKKFQDIEIISSETLSDCLSDSWSEVGKEETLIITRSNKRANQYNQGIRREILFAESPLERGEKIIISKNDYFWSKKNDVNGFIANGDIAEVEWIGTPIKKYGRWFVEVELQFPGIENSFSANLMLRSLIAEGPSVPRQEMERFYNSVLASYEGELSHKIKGALQDPYYNALQAKYAYCVTCHKAQGGQWKHVYIDLGGLMINENENLADFYRWLYTAVTRATEKVFFINPRIRIK